MFWIATLACLGAACGPIPLPDSERKRVVHEIAEAVALPTFADADQKADALGRSAAALVDSPSPENLAAMREAWRQARAPWKEAGAFLFGPASDLATASAIDWWPVDTEHVEQEILGTSELTEAYVETLGTNRKGFHALEYLLFDPSGDDAAVLETLTTSMTAPRRRQFLLALALNVGRRVGQLRQAWSSEGGNYFTRFTEPGRTDSAFPTIKAALDAIVNESIFLGEFVANNRLGKPLGTGTGGIADPSLEESGRSDNSVHDMVGNLRSVRNVYLGTRSGTAGLGITTLVAKKSASTDAAVRSALDDAIFLTENIPSPYRSALVDQRGSVEAAYQSVKTLKRLLSTEMVTLMGTTLKFNDNDGD
jgi:putative iron-regulated protein